MAKRNTLLPCLLSTSIAMNQRAANFDLMRFAAVSLVFWSHQYSIVGFDEPMVPWIGSLGSFAVYVFFAIGACVFGAADRAANVKVRKRIGPVTGLDNVWPRWLAIIKSGRSALSASDSMHRNVDRSDLGGPPIPASIVPTRSNGVHVSAERFDHV
ncbi:hypothetical protein [Bradyrhizobium sp. 156]|uniref:hypothetical protein n=1 Tax=Bradyrhizobium sp. 156 TaxID=2782630 RepID=UPI001FFA4A69|nr:hypothetical protein [Bradyrhizobium sp. 156]